MTSHSGPSTMVLTPINLDILLQNNKCSGCDRRLNPDAKQPKDQALSCQKCGNSFHKKCTDRIQMRANWQRDPWFCQSCVRGTDSYSTISSSPSLHDNIATAARQYLQIEDDSIMEVSERVASETPENIDSPLNPRALEFFHHSTLTLTTPLLTEPPSTATTHSLNTTTITTTTNTIPTIRFPNNSSKQRGSNIKTTDPEEEFRQTALDSCRSTIAQQEADIKKWKEANAIRNRKIIQLEDQVTVAAEHVASRDPSNNHNIDDRTDNTALEKKVVNILETLLSKKEKLGPQSQSPVVNNIHIYNTTGSNSKTEVSIKVDQTTQTEEISTNQTITDAEDTPTDNPINCDICNSPSTTKSSLETHKLDKHAVQKESQLSFEHTCDHCSRKFKSIKHLLEHTETEHATSFLNCPSCKYRCKTRTHLKDHIEVSHKKDPPQTSLRDSSSQDPSNSSSKASAAAFFTNTRSL